VCEVEPSFFIRPVHFLWGLILTGQPPVDHLATCKDLNCYGTVVQKNNENLDPLMSPQNVLIMNDDDDDDDG
jgi:hypothetical protein